MNKGRLIIYASILFWIVENFWFGWNYQAQSTAERICDMLATLMFVFGIWVTWMVSKNKLYGYMRQFVDDADANRGYVHEKYRKQLRDFLKTGKVKE